MTTYKPLLVLVAIIVVAMSFVQLGCDTQGPVQIQEEQIEEPEPEEPPTNEVTRDTIWRSPGWLSDGTGSSNVKIRSNNTDLFYASGVPTVTMALHYQSPDANVLFLRTQKTSAELYPKLTELSRDSTDKGELKSVTFEAITPCFRGNQTGEIVLWAVESFSGNSLLDAELRELTDSLNAFSEAIPDRSCD